MARKAPFPFIVAGSVAIAPNTIVNVTVAGGTSGVGTVVPATNLATSLGITIGSTTVDVGEAISVVSVKDASQTLLVRAGGTIAKGDLVAANASGLAVTTVSGTLKALEAGVVNQLINVISAEAF